MRLAFQLLLAERRQGHAEKADAFCDREQGLEQRVAKLLDFGSRRKERLTGPASRDLLEIGIFHFECHRASANLCPLASAPDLFDDRLERLAGGLECEDIGGKGVFRTKRLADPVGSDRPFVDAARDPVIVGAGLPEMLLKEGKRLLYILSLCSAAAALIALGYLPARGLWLLFAVGVFHSAGPGPARAAQRHARSRDRSCGPVR